MLRALTPILVALFLAGSPASAEKTRVRGDWWSDSARSKQAQLAAATDQDLIAELADANWIRRFELAKEMSLRSNVAIFVPSWRPFLVGENRIERCYAGLVLARAGIDEGLAVVLQELAASAAELQQLPDRRMREFMTQEEYWRRRQEANHVRHAATQTLGLIGDARALPSLVEATRDPGTAPVAALSLGEIGDRRAIPALREMARQHPSERHWAGWGLALLGEDDGFALLIDVAGSNLPWDQRRHAILALGELRHRGAVALLAGVLRDPEVHLRVAAARALGEIGDPAALPALHAALGDQTRTRSNEDVSVSEVVAAAVRQIEAARP